MSETELAKSVREIDPQVADAIEDYSFIVRWNAADLHLNHQLKDAMRLASRSTKGPISSASSARFR